MMCNNPAWADNAQHRSDFKLEHMCDSGCQRCDLIQNVVTLISFMCYARWNKDR